MTLRWITCIVVSLAIHMTGLWCCDHLDHPQPPRTIVPVAVAQADPPTLLAELPQMAAVPLPDRTEPKPEVAAEMTERFRPNVEPQEPVEEPAAEPRDSIEDEQQETAAETPPVENSTTETDLSPEEKKEAIETYRSRLTQQFQEQWRQVPELNTVVEDVAMLPRIDGHFGIVVLAYSFVDHKPGPPFFLFNMRDGSAQKTDRFEFAGFSNRIKDRMLYTQYRAWLDDARRTHGVNSLMKVIGLVPAKADHYFCSKQLRAIQLANVPPETVRTTNGHYEPDGAGGFNLIIDSVVTKDGRTIGIQDEELKFSVVAKQ